MDVSDRRSAVVWNENERRVERIIRKLALLGLARVEVVKVGSASSAPAEASSLGQWERLP